MKPTRKNAVLMIALVILLAPVKGYVCEKHAKATGSSGTTQTPLPDQSLYNVESLWMDRSGNATHLEDLRGHPRLIAMIFTKCPTACPLTVQALKSLLSPLSSAQRAKLKIGLFSFDDGETSQSMDAFTEKFKLGENWRIYKSSTAGVAELAGALNVHYKKLPSGEFIHANVIFLVDQEGVVIAKHEGLGNASAEFMIAVDRVLGADTIQP